MFLNELLNKVKVIQVNGDAEKKEIGKISIDSRDVDEKTIFFAIKGFKTDGHKFIPDVLNKNVAAIVVDNPDAVPEELFAHSGCVKIVVNDSRKSLAEFSNFFYGEPSKKLKLVGITGTKGKTTTGFYIKKLFEKAGFKTGLIGTNANYIGGKVLKSSLTTPQSNEINYLMSEMISAGCTHCVMEVSSHALDLYRVDYLDFDYAVFTNITSDHMDYHQTFEHYLQAKKKLFDMMQKGKTVIYNIDDKNSDKLISGSTAKKYSYGTRVNSDFKISNVEYDLEGTNFSITYEEDEVKVSTKLVGMFNAYNAASAFSIGVLEGFQNDKIQNGILATPQVPGRFEVITHGNKKVIIDYSHTSDSLKQALTAVQHINKDKRPVYTVFGCGGDRDTTKRPVMGEIASSMSDKVVITSDNPRTEDPFKIIDDIIKGVKTKNYKIIEDREEAIKSAVCDSEDNAVILVAGKGHETYQDRNGVKKYFSDKETAEKYLQICHN